MREPGSATGEKPDRGDLELAIHALGGILGALDHIKDGYLNDVAGAWELLNMEHALIIASRLITEHSRRRF